MKYSFLLLSFCILITACVSDSVPNPDEMDAASFLNTSLIIDEMDGSKNISGNELLDIWSKEQSAIMEESIEFKEVSVERVKDVNGNYLSDKIFVKSRSLDGSVSIGAIFTQTGKTGTYQRGKTCKCTGCAQGCDLSVEGNRCSCSSCFPNDSGDCVKEETIVVNDN